MTLWFSVLGGVGGLIVLLIIILMRRKSGPTENVDGIRAELERSEWARQARRQYSVFGSGHNVGGSDLDEINKRLR